MKKVLILVSVIATILLASCGSPEKTSYSKEELQEAIAEAEYEAYKRGYDEGAYYARAGLVSEEELDHAYEAGYERGYEDCLADYGLD